MQGRSTPRGHFTISDTRTPGKRRRRSWRGIFQMIMWSGGFVLWLLFQSLVILRPADNWGRSSSQSRIDPSIRLEAMEAADEVARRGTREWLQAYREELQERLQKKRNDTGALIERYMSEADDGHDPEPITEETAEYENALADETVWEPSEDDEDTDDEVLDD